MEYIYMNHKGFKNVFRHIPCHFPGHFPGLQFAQGPVKPGRMGTAGKADDVIPD